MRLLITEILFGNVNTIEIPITSDSIFLLPILIGFGLIISCSQYIFKELKERKIFVLSKNQINNQLELKECIKERSPQEKTIINKLSTFSYPQLVGLGSLAFLALGGSGLLVLQAGTRNLPHVPKTSELNNSKEIKKNKSESLSFNIEKMSINPKKEVQKIKYVSPTMSRLKRTRETQYTIIQSIQNQKYNF